MTGQYLYPRLDSTPARALLAQRVGMTLDQLYDESDTTHPQAAPSATGGQPVPPRVLDRLRNTIRTVADQAGYPAPIARSDTQKFDRPCGTALLSSMDVIPADAADQGVWSFLTLVLVPEIGPWRFPGLSENRLLGHPRNVLRRTWWRAWALGPDLDTAPEGCRPLGEDEFVQIMERPSLGGNTRTATALRDAVWRAERARLPGGRSEIMREMARRLRAQRSHLLLDALTDTDLTALLDRLADESSQNLTRNTTTRT